MSQSISILLATRRPTLQGAQRGSGVTTQYTPRYPDTSLSGAVLQLNLLRHVRIHNCITRQALEIPKLFSLETEYDAQTSQPTGSRRDRRSEIEIPLQ